MILHVVGQFGTLSYIMHILVKITCPGYIVGGANWCKVLPSFSCFNYHNSHDSISSSIF